MSKLVKTGQVEWREGEVQLAEYRKFTPEQKKAHLDLLLQMQPDELSFNDKHILYSEMNYKYKFKQEVKNFFSLCEEDAHSSSQILDDKLVTNFLDNKISTNIDKILDEYNSTKIGADAAQKLEQISLLKKEDMRKILAKFFINYNFWEIDLRKYPIEIFLSNTANEYAYDAYITELVKRYKNI